MSADDRDVRSVGEALDRLVHELGLDDRRPAVAVQERWREVAGPEVAAHAAARKLEDGLLTVEVDDPAWATHLRFLAPSLAASLNEAVGGAVVREIRVVVGRR